MKPAALKILGLVLGAAMAIAAIDLAWDLAARWFPSAVSLDSPDADTLEHYVLAMPLSGQLTIVLGYGLASLVGAFLALRIAQWRPAGWLIAAVVIASGVWNLTQLAEPLWMQLATVVAPLIGAWLAERHFHRARPGDALFS